MYGEKYTVSTHWGRVTHICVNKLTIIGSDNGLSPGRRQAIIWTNAGILLIGPFSEILIEIPTFSFKKMRLEVSSAKLRPSCLGLNVLTHWPSHACMRQQTNPSLVQIMACIRLATKPLSEPKIVNETLTYSNEILFENQMFSFKIMRLKISFGKCPSCRLGLNILNWSLLFFVLVIMGLYG